MVIQMSTSEEIDQLPVPLEPDCLENHGERLERPTNLRLDPSLYNINWEAQEPQHGTQHTSTDKVVDQMCTIRGGSRQMLLNGPSKAKKKDIAESISEKDRHKASVILCNSMASQGPEGLVSVCELIVMLVVLKQSLNPFERSENGFCCPGKQCRHTSGGKLGSTAHMLAEQA